MHQTGRITDGGHRRTRSGNVLNLASLHLGRDIWIHNSKGPAESTAGLRLGELGERGTSHCAKQLDRSVPYPQQPQRMARGVIAPVMGIACCYVDNTQYVDQELGQLEGARPELGCPRSQRLVACAPRDHSVLVASRRYAGAGRGDHEFVVFEGVAVATH